jgi:hypothetical protein
VDEIDLTPDGEGWAGRMAPIFLGAEGPGYLTVLASNDLHRKRWRRVGRYYIRESSRWRGWCGPATLGYITERYVRWRFTPRKRRASTPSSLRDE